MAPKKPKTDKPSFEQLQELWYKKLKDSGFDDIESDEFNLKIWSSRFADRHADPILWQAKEEYYRLAEAFLHEHKFASSLEKTIWTYHANGMSARDISKTLIEAKVSTLSKSAVWLIISKIEGAMKRKHLFRKPNPNEQ